MSKIVEYRVRPVTRFIVTRCHSEDDGPRQGGGVGQCGEFQNEQMAYDVGYALCRAEHEQLGYPADDARIKYPVPPVVEPVLSGPIGGGLVLA